MQGAQLVAVRIAQVGEVELALAAFAHAGRVLAGGPAGGDARRVPGVGLGRRGAGKANGAAVAGRGRLAIDRLAHREDARGRDVEDPVPIHPGRRHAQRAEHGVVEGLGRLQVIGADHDVREHRCFPLQRPPNAGGSGAHPTGFGGWWQWGG